MVLSCSEHAFYPPKLTLDVANSDVLTKLSAFEVVQVKLNHVKHNQNHSKF